MDDKEKAWELSQAMPTIVMRDDQSLSRYGLLYQAPDLLLRHLDKLVQCPMLHKDIEQVCQRVLDWGIYDIDWVELTFSFLGFGVHVPGNACDCFVDGNSVYISNHNIDSPLQVMCLWTFFTLSLRLIYERIWLWEQDPEAQLSSGSDRVLIRIKRDPGVAPFRLWEAGDDLLSVSSYAWARSFKEAEEVIDEDCDSVMPCVSTKPIKIPVRQWRLFEVKVLFEDDQAKPLKREVIALNEDMAIETAEEHYRTHPALFPIAGFEVKNEEGKPLKSQIVQTLQ